MIEGSAHASGTISSLRDGIDLPVTCPAILSWTRLWESIVSFSVSPALPLYTPCPTQLLKLQLMSPHVATSSTLTATPTQLNECKWIILSWWSWLVVNSSASWLLGCNLCIALSRCRCARLSVTLTTKCVFVFMRSFRKQHISFDFDVIALVIHVLQHMV